MGPIERQLYLRVAAVRAIPAGGSIADGIAFFLDQPHRSRIMIEAREWTEKAILAVRMAADADPRWTNEQIAERILAKLMEKQKAILDAHRAKKA